MILVSWNDAKAYVTWLKRMTGKEYRLLTEAEWEYAARAGTTTRYPWGDEIGKNNANCNGCGSQWDIPPFFQTAPVGSFKPNAFGLYDMHGNVWQWVEDCYQGTYEGAPTDGSNDISGDCTRRVLRGGSFIGEDPSQIRSAIRFAVNSDARVSFIGFRVGRTLTP